MLSVEKTKDQQLIISKLCEIFSFDKEVIISVCEAQNWQIDDCIENLITFGDNYRTATSTKNSEPNRKNESYASALQNINKENIQDVAQDLNENQNFNNLGAVPKNVNNFEKNLNELIASNRHIKIIAEHITSGHKIMVLMRGAPGSGKSYLARQLLNLVDEPGKYDSKSFICSTDDYFYDINDRYLFQPEKLSEAHESNQKRVRRKAMEGWSPLIIDNTNIRIWELLPYVQIAVQYGYILELLEPNTPWRNSVSKLALKNKHGVTKERIKRILINYEPVSKNHLLQMMKNTKYTVPLPQLRRYPPLTANNFEFESPVKEAINIKKDKLSSEKIEPNQRTKESFDKGNFFAGQKQQFDILHDENTTTYKAPEFPSAVNGQIALNFDSWKKVDEGRNKMEMQNGSLPSEETISSHSWGVYNSVKLSDSTNQSDKQNATLFEQSKQDYDVYNNTWMNYGDSDNKRPQAQPASGSNTKQSETFENEEDENFQIAEWQPYEEERNTFWNIDKNCMPKPQRNAEKKTSVPHENIFKILKEPETKNVNLLKNEEATKKCTDASDAKIERHSTDCPKENEYFTLVRQICPDKNVNGLWDLFEKCNGNAQWVLDILLKDDTTVESIDSESEVSDFKCYCNDGEGALPKISCDEINIDEEPTKNNQNNYSNGNGNDIFKQKGKKEKTIITDELMEVKKTIENKVVIDNSLYSEHVRKIRNTKHGIADNLLSAVISGATQNQLDDNGSEEMPETKNDDEMIEINLGEAFIHQLENRFGTRPATNLKNLKTNIFMPISLGKQLYALWMESIYNQLEEEKQETIKKDEEFATLLQSSSRTNIEKRETYKDILDMELAWSIYKANPDGWKDKVPQNLASHLAHSKLCEIFPDIEKETLLQLLQANGNSYSQTIKALNASTDEDCSDLMNEKKINLITLAKKETEDKQMDENLINNNHGVKKLSPDEAKKAALRDFEQCRNLSAHHSQLKAECYEKAKEAIQQGNTAVAVYYSQISNLHKNKIDYYNHKAANCIMEVHDLTQNNPDFIDLHYLYTMEALECLDIFLDNHILKLRNVNRPYKHIFIITGRGLHSAKGVSTIKKKVKDRLKDRTLKWNEVNPGLLRVKIFSGSKFSKNS